MALDQQGSVYQIANFMNPEAGILPLYSWALFWYTKFIVMMSKGGSTKITLFIQNERHEHIEKKP